jgi:hypothetical protein
MRPILAGSLSLVAILLSIGCSGEKASVPSNSNGFAVAPNTGNGASRRFSIQFADRTAGKARLLFAQVLFGNASAGSPPFCFIHYDPKINGLKLYKGPGPEDFTAAATLGVSSDILQNDACQIDPAASSASTTAQGLALDITVNFRPALAGDRVIYGRTLDDVGSDTGWQRMGTWTVPASAK